MHSGALVSAIVHICTDAPKAAIEKACDILACYDTAAVSAMGGLTGILSKESLVRLKQGLKGTTPTAKELALALRSTVAGIEAGKAMPDIQLVWTGPDTPQPSPRDTMPQMLEMIGRASQSILLVTFAAFKAARIMDALLSAHKKGVKVTLVVESAVNSAGQLTHEAWKAFPKPLVEAGCLWFWPLAKRPKNQKGIPGKLHAKVLVIDGTELLVSSANLTDDAMERNIEVGLRCSRGTAAADLSEKFASMVAAGHLTKLVSG